MIKERDLKFIALGFIIGGLCGLGIMAFLQIDYFESNTCFTNEQYEDISAYQIYCAIHSNVSYEEVNNWWNSRVGQLDIAFEGVDEQ